MDYQGANGILGTKMATTLKYATQLVRRADTGAIVLLLHDTEIVEYRADNTVVLNVGQWPTVFTKERMHEYLIGSGVSVGSNGGAWYVSTRAGRFPFFNGIRIDLATGAVMNLDAAPDFTSNKDLEKLIKKLIGALTIEDVRRMLDTRAYDCWACRAGDTSGGHLWGHLCDGEINGTLLVNAFKAYDRGRNPVDNLHYYARYDCLDRITATLRKYLRGHLRVGVFTVSGLRLAPDSSLAKRYGA